jgi:hypothetical protein
MRQGVLIGSAALLRNLGCGHESFFVTLAGLISLAVIIMLFLQAGVLFRREYDLSHVSDVNATAGNHSIPVVELQAPASALVKSSQLCKEHTRIQWEMEPGAMKLSTDCGFLPHSFSTLRPIKHRIVFLKVHKTGSSTFAALLYNAANRRRQRVLTKESRRKEFRVSREMEQIDTIPTEFALNHFFVDAADQAANPTLLLDWYTKQMHGLQNADTNMAPLLFLSSFRDPFKRLQSFFAYFVLQNRKHASFGEWIDSLALDAPSQISFFGIKSPPQLDTWWEAFGKNVIWLLQEEMQKSFLLVRSYAELQLYELASLRTQSSSVRVNKYAALWNVSASSLMAVSEQQMARAQELLSLDYEFYQRAKQSFNARWEALQHQLNPSHLDWETQLLVNISNHVEYSCGTLNGIKARLSKDELDNTPYPHLCHALRDSMHGRQRKQSSGEGLLPLQLVCEEEQDWWQLFQNVATQ